MAASQVMRITLKAYDHQLIDASAKSIIETVKKTGSKVSGPVPMPTKKEIITGNFIIWCGFLRIHLIKLFKNLQCRHAFRKELINFFIILCSNSQLPFLHIYPIIPSVSKIWSSSSVFIA